MTKLITTAFALTLVSACADVSGGSDRGPTQPVTPPPDEQTETAVPEQIAGNLRSVDYQPDGDEARITLLYLDSGEVLQQYTRQTDFDVVGGGTVFDGRAVTGTSEFRAFTHQEGPNGRFVTVLVARSDDDAVQATVATDGGRLGYFFGGADYRQLTAYVAPESGLATYTGTYVGLINIKIRDDYVNVDTGLPEIAQSGRSSRTVGDVILYADFADNAVEGLIFNRAVENDAYELRDVVLRNTTVDANGSFVGEAQQRNPDPEVPGLQTIGVYGGVFGGNQASAVAGGMNIGGFDPDRTALTETGIFVLNCGVAEPTCRTP